MRHQRILQVVGSLNVGGAEKMILEATRRLHLGSTTDFLVFGPQTGHLESAAQALGSNVIRLPAPSATRLREHMKGLAAIMNERGPYKVVHSHVNLATGPILSVAESVGVPIRVAHSHSARDIYTTPLRRAYRIAAKRCIVLNATHFVACGDEAGRHLFGQRRWETSGISVRNGIDTKPFLASRYARQTAREIMGVSEPTTRVVGMVARFVDFKNHDFMIDVALESSRTRSPFLFVFVGDGPLRLAVEARVRRMRLHHNVRFLGLRDDIPVLLSGMDIVAAPSWYEGLPVNLIEAQAAGKKILASTGVTREVDLGLGLMEFLPIDRPGQWRAALQDVALPHVADSEIEATFLRTGYESLRSAETLQQIYGSSSDVQR